MTGALLDTVLAQPTAVTTLERALATGRVHHAYLFDGPPGVGKERAAFGLAQALVCETPRDGGRACGVCNACRRAVPRDGENRPVHPDVVVLERGLYDKAMLGRRTEETRDISIDQVRVLVLARAAFAPHEGRAKVFVVRRADELSVSAANALLKTLEEPGQKTHFILMSSEAGGLLSTIRSRTQRVRFGALPDDVVAKLLVERGEDPARAAETARLAGGSMETATSLIDPDESAKRDAFVAKALAAIKAPTLGPALELAETAKGAKREGVARQIAALAAAIAQRERSDVARGAAEAAEDDSAPALFGLALAAIRQLDGNGQPQLVVEAMLARMRGAA
jgi:DNA polymerase-3 subunit delta'